MQMEIAQQTRFETAHREVRSHYVTILLGYTVFAILGARLDLVFGQIIADIPLVR
jgi:uncharacterized membrane protein YoaK (UPF0700 family)